MVKCPSCQKRPISCTLTDTRGTFSMCCYCANQYGIQTNQGVLVSQTLSELRWLEWQWQMFAAEWGR